MIVTTSRFWLAWLVLMCVGIAICTRQASQVYKKRNVAKESELEERKPQWNHNGGEATAAETEKGKAVAMKMFNRDAVLGPQQPNDIECSPTTTRQQQQQRRRRRHQDKRNQNRYNNNNDDNDDDNNNHHINDVKLEKDDKARRTRWVENICGFIKRPLVDYIYQQAIEARMQKLQELDVTSHAQLLPTSMRPTRSHRRKRQPRTGANTWSPSNNLPAPSGRAPLRTRLTLDKLKNKLMELLNKAVGYANTAEQLSKKKQNGHDEASCSCHRQLLKSTTYTFTSKF